MTPKRHCEAALDVRAGRQFVAWANHRRAGAHEMARDFKLGCQLAPTMVSNGGAADLRDDR
jgi:hypothetical protein